MENQTTKNKARQVENYILKLPHIGEGSFGKVYQCYQKETRQIYAVKAMEAKHIFDSTIRKEKFIRELKINAKLNHMNIARLFDIKRTQNNFYLFFEYCNGHDLGSFLSLHCKYFSNPPSELIIQHFVRQIVSALSYLQSLNSVHRDIKLENIMLTFDKIDYSINGLPHSLNSDINDNTDKFLKKLKVDQTLKIYDSMINPENTLESSDVNRDNLFNEETVSNPELFENIMLKSKIKIIDFGLARELIEEGKNISICGSPLNIPPEIWGVKYGNSFPQKIEHFHKFDAWSLGCIVYQLFTSNPPFYANDYPQLYEEIKKGKYFFSREKNPSVEIIDFIQGLLQFNPKDRFTWEEIVNHPFVKSNVKDFTLMPKPDDNSDWILNSKTKEKFINSIYEEPQPEISSYHEETISEMKNTIEVLEEVKPCLSDSTIEALFNLIVVEEEIIEEEEVNGYIKVDYNLKYIYS